MEKDIVRVKTESYKALIKLMKIRQKRNEVPPQMG